MEKMKPLLINEGTDAANQQIQDHKLRARIMSELIQAYNNMPHISDIELAADAKDFLTNPVQFLDEMILNCTGVTGTGKVKPIASEVARFYGINYSSIFQRINGALPHLKNLDRFGFDEGSRTIVLLPEGEDAIREGCRQYLKSEDDILQYNKLKSICDQLNELCKEYNVGNPEINQVGGNLPFLASKPGKAGEKYYLIPNVNLIRHKNGRSII